MTATPSRPVASALIEHAWRVLGQIVEGLRGGTPLFSPDDLEHALRIISRHQSETEAILEDGLRDAGQSWFRAG
jgi:hypothetical protein